MHYVLESCLKSYVRNIKYELRNWKNIRALAFTFNLNKNYKNNCQNFNK